MTDLNIGDVVAGKYEIKKLLGGGGMGVVYLAYQRALRREVALKVLSDRVVELPNIVERFKREAMAVANLHHDNIVQVYDFHQDDGLSFITMEFIKGSDLKKLIIESPGNLRVGDLATIMRCICAGVSHAHRHRVIHRDIKPENVMVARLDGGHWRVKVMDFGLAHVAASAEFSWNDGPQLTAVGQQLGTKGYMPPEQIRGSSVSLASDIYSFACVAFGCLARRPVFERDNRDAMNFAHVFDPPPPIRSIVPDVPEAVETLILQCLEKDPALRPQDIAALGRDIERALAPISDMPMRELWPKSPQGSDGTTIPIICSPPALPEPGTRPVPSDPANLPPTPYIAPTTVDPKLGDMQTLDLGSGVSMTLVWIPPGTFMMGSAKAEQDWAVGEGASRHQVDPESPQTRVTLTRGFWMGDAPVNQAQWKQVMGLANDPSYFKGNALPVERVSWNDAMDFCRKLSLDARRSVTLPTEAQWEFACRAGTATRFSFGDDDSVLGDYAWYDSNSGGRTRPARGKAPNPWGLYDIHGNVWEWCLDILGEYPGGTVTDPTGPPTGSSRVLRGGAWNRNARHCRSACRVDDDPACRYNNFGFRVVAVP